LDGSWEDALPPALPLPAPAAGAAPPPPPQHGPRTLLPRKLGQYMRACCNWVGTIVPGVPLDEQPPGQCPHFLCQGAPPPVLEGSKDDEDLYSYRYAGCCHGLCDPTAHNPRNPHDSEECCRRLQCRSCYGVFINTADAKVHIAKVGGCWTPPAAAAAGAEVEVDSDEEELEGQTFFFSPMAVHEG
jgi:hypothetical protein